MRQAGCIVLCLILLAWGTWARATVNVTVQRLTHGAMTFQQLHLTLATDAAGRLHLQLDVGRIDAPTFGWRRVGMHLDGTLLRTTPTHWQFDGAVALTGAPGGMLERGQLRLAIDGDADTIAVNVAQQSATLDAALPLDQPTHARLKLHNLPLRWLQGLLATAWSGKLTGGRLSGVLAVDVTDGGVRTSGDLALAGGGFDTPDGKLAGQNLDVRGRVTLDATGKADTLGADLVLRGGQVLLGPMYAALPGHDVHLSLQAVLGPRAIELRELRFTDPGTLHLDGSVALGSDGVVRGIHLEHFTADLAAAYAVYGKAWLATLGLGDLTVTGQVAGSLWLDAKGLRAFRVDAQQVDLRGDRLAVTGLAGTLDWLRAGDRPATTLGWRSLGFYDIGLGPAQAHWQSRAGALTLAAPLDVPVLGGHLHVGELAWNPAAGNGSHLQTALAVTGVDVTRLCTALGWPKFGGTLAGSVPGLRYAGDVIELDGGLSLSVFGGHVDVTRMALQHPFGDAPVMSTDIALRQLDLANLTGVFDFGRITGRLDGDVAGLRLVDWKPVAFEASLHTTGNGGRISQRAVNNLTSVGGGGMASGLQGAVLKLFDTFGYRHIGLSCTLEGSVCHMSGLKPAGGGYLIVEGRGLPHLSVVGHQHEVSWPTLVSRLKAAIQGGTPVVR